MATMASQPFGTHTLRLFEPPPVERQMNAALANFWQKAVSSVKPALVTTSDSQLRKQSMTPVDSKGAQTSAIACGHSPGTAQQSVSAAQPWVQYPFGT